MNVYTELGIEPIINAAGTLTTLSGSIMPPEVTDAMAVASRVYVDLNELHVAAGKRIAELIGVEAAYVTAGAAAGIALMAAACMTGRDGARARQLPDTTGMRDHFVVQRAHRNFFDIALSLTGGRFIEIDDAAEQLEAALSRDDVAATYFTHAWFCRLPALPLSQIVEAAHARGVPVILDAAAEVPPLANLRRFLDEGADLVAFSGGKAIRGPQSTGMLLGRTDLVEAARLNGNPNMGVGRPMKVGKEEIAGLVKAVELYVGKDHDREMAVWERRVAHIVATLGDIEGVEVWRQMPYGIGQRIPHAALHWDEAELCITHAEAVERLKRGRPRVAIQLVQPESYHFSGFDRPEVRVHPHTLQEGEEMTVAKRMRIILTEEEG